jgi:hypothetical protein
LRGGEARQVRVFWAIRLLLELELFGG